MFITDKLGLGAITCQMEDEEVEASECGIHKIELGKPRVTRKLNYVVNIKVMKFTTFRIQAA